MSIEGTETRLNEVSASRVAAFFLERQNRVNQIEHMAGDYYYLIFVTRPWEELKCASDYYDMLHTRETNRPFELMNKMSALVEETVDSTTNTGIAPITFSEMISSARFIPTYQKDRNGIATDKRRPSGQLIPYAPYQMFLYHMLMKGAEPWSTVSSTYHHLTAAMRKNPPAALALMQTVGFDLMLPDFPASTMEEIPTVTEIFETWDGTEDGVQFFSEAMKKVGLSNQTADETAETYWQRCITMLPDLEKHLDTRIPQGQNQRPEYYMEICRALAYFPLHRKLQFDEMQEAVSALVVREGKILGASYNIPTDRPHFHEHAEQVAIKKAVKASGDPFLAGASLYINIEPCIECGPIIRKYDFSELYFGPRTLMGADTRSGLFTVQDTTEEIPSGDFLKEQGEPYFPIPSVVVFNMFYDEMVELIVNGQKWKRFILPIQNK